MVFMKNLRQYNQYITPLAWKLILKFQGFILERTWEGIDTPSIPGKYSLRASETGMIFLDNVKVYEILFFSASQISQIGPRRKPSSLC